MKHIISLSGGKDSTAMLLMMIEKKMPIDKIICVDTTKEFPAMYRHIEKLKEHIRPFKIEIIKIDFNYWFGEHIKTKGKNIGKKGYGWADFRNRWCTSLKREVVNKYIKKNTIEYQGIAVDEIKRINNNKNRNIKYPLVEWGITEKQALEYCYSKGFDWEGLYKDFVRVSCYCCPLQRIGELKTLCLKYPNLWQKMLEMDKKSFRKFRPDYTLKQLDEKFKTI